MPVITISRQVGAGGETVAKMLAERLKIDVLDRQLIAEVARRLEYPRTEVEEHDERPTGFLNRLLTALAEGSVEMMVPSDVRPWVDPELDPKRAILKITRQIVDEAARTRNVVIVGHGAAYVLRDFPGALRVFLRASRGFRTKAVMELFSLGEADAKKRLKETDANRAGYIKQLYGYDWYHTANYDMAFDTSALGFGAVVDAIVAVVKARERLSVLP
jgi:cytidylate kinase